MSGILDKKSRIFDFVITENGRKQMQNGDIRYRFASLSDKSIMYTKDYELSKQNKADISNSEFNYIPLEANTKINDEINPEFDLSNYFLNNNNNQLNVEDLQNSSNLDTSINQFISDFSLGNSLKNLKYLTTSAILNKTSPLSFFDSGYLNNDLDFKNSTNLYHTIKSYSINKNNIPVIALDKRFSHKNNFMFLPPVNTEGEELYERNNFKNINDLDEENSSGYLLTSYNNKISNNQEILSREKEILEVINNMEKNQKLLKRVYEIENNSEICSLIFEIYEEKTINKNIEKLSFIKVGDFYDKKNATTKKVYLVGKIINTRDDTKDIDVMFNFNNGTVNLNNDSNTFVISSYFSFVNLFTLVVE